MYNPNERGSTNPPPRAENYGAAYHQDNYYGKNQINNNTYDVPPPGQQKDYYYSTPPFASGNGVLYDEFSLNEFSSTKIRHGFIRKVYSILSLQLLLTFSFSALAVLSKPVNTFIMNYYPLFFVLGVALSLPILLALACYPAIARKFPTNYLLLLLITIGMTLLVSAASAKTRSEIFFQAFATTAVVVIGLTIFAFQTKWDFTGWHVYLFMAFLILFFLGILGLFFRSKIFNLVFAGISAMLLSFSIIIDTQLIVGGKHKKYEFSVDDYIFATLALYMDIVNLFLTILSIFSNSE